MLKNAYSLAKIGADTAENEQHFAEFLPIGRRVIRTSPVSSWAEEPVCLDELAHITAQCRGEGAAMFVLTEGRTDLV